MDDDESHNVGRNKAALQPVGLNQGNTPALRGEGGMYRKGTPGGPGRPKMDPEVKRILSENTVAAVQKLVDLLEAERSVVVGDGDSARVETVPDGDLQLKAAQAILDRAYGKPAQAVTPGEGFDNIMAAVIILPGERSDDE